MSRFRDLERQAGIGAPSMAPPSLSTGELLGELRQAQQANAQLQQILHQRAEPILTQAIDALSTVARLAAQGHPQAKVLIGKWKEALALAEGVETSIIIATEIPSARG